MIWFSVFFNSIRWSCFLRDDKISAFFLKKTFNKSWYSKDTIVFKSVTWLLSCFFTWIFRFLMNTTNISTFFWRDKISNKAIAIEWISIILSSFDDSSSKILFETEYSSSKKEFLMLRYRFYATLFFTIYVFVVVLLIFSEI